MNLTNLLRSNFVFLTFLGFLWSSTEISTSFMIKFGHNERALSLVERACSIRVRSWDKVVTASAKLYYVRPFPRLLSSFFSLIESEIRNRRADRVSRDEILQEKTKWVVRLLKVFTLSKIVSLRSVIKSTAANTRLVHINIVSFSKTKQTKQERRKIWPNWHNC